MFLVRYELYSYTLFRRNNLPYVYDYIINYASNNQKSYKIMRMNMFGV
jgi:hypothetical protein